MSGTFSTLTPCGQSVVSPAGVIHWCAVPSLIQGVVPPCRWSVARLSVKQLSGFGYSLHAGLRIASMTVPSSVGSGMSIGSMPEPISEESVGRNRSPSEPVGSRLWNTIRTGLFLVAAIVGPSHCGGVTASHG